MLTKQDEQRILADMDAGRCGPPGSEPLTRQQIINELEEHSRKMFEEEPENMDLPAAVAYWHSLTDADLQWELEAARERNA